MSKHRRRRRNTGAVGGCLTILISPIVLLFQLAAVAVQILVGSAKIFSLTLGLFASILVTVPLLIGVVIRALYDVIVGVISFTAAILPVTSPNNQPRLLPMPLGSNEYIYFIRQRSSCLYKIGRSNNPNSRIRSLSTANPYGIENIHIQPVLNMSFVEMTLHRKYNNHRLNGEWFSFDSSEARQVIADMQGLSGTELAHFPPQFSGRTGAAITISVILILIAIVSAIYIY